MARDVVKAAKSASHVMKVHQVRTNRLTGDVQAESHSLSMVGMDSEYSRFPLPALEIHCPLHRRLGTTPSTSLH